MKNAAAILALIAAAACGPAPTPVPDEDDRPALECQGAVVNCLVDADVGNVTKGADGACFECVEVNVEGLDAAWTRIAPCPF